MKQHQEDEEQHFSDLGGARAIPVKPNTAAMIATMKNTNA
jgi:hypothetical protein